VLDRLRRALVARGPIQESIARGLGAHNAEQSAAQTAEDSRRQQIAQANGGVRLRIDLWEGMTTDQPVPGDTMALADCVMITNPSYSTELNSANLVYEQVGDRAQAVIYGYEIGLVTPGGNVGGLP
jgi:hypothetical protein